MTSPVLAYCRSSIPGLSVDEQIRLAKSAGVAVSLDLGAKELREFSAFNKLVLNKNVFSTVIAYDTHGQNLVSDPALRLRFIPYFREIVKAAVQSRSKGILVALYEKKKITDKSAVSFFLELSGYVPRGKKILLEVLNKERTSFYPSVKELLKFKSKLPASRFGLAVDTWHMHESEKDLYKTLTGIIPFVDSIHLKDTHSLVPGQGLLDWDKIKDIILSSNYRGELLVECKAFGSPGEFQRHVLFMKKLLGITLKRSA